jgi:hypothetical protein
MITERVHLAPLEVCRKHELHAWSHFSGGDEDDKLKQVYACF